MSLTIESLASGLAMDNCSDSYLWSLYATEMYRKLLTGDPGMVAQRAGSDPAFRASLKELYKVWLIDRAGARVREAYADRLMNALHRQLTDSGVGDLQSLGEAKVLHQLLPPMPEPAFADVRLMQPRLSSFPRLDLPIAV